MRSGYRIVYSQLVAQQLKARADRAARAGFGQELVAALKTIVQSLADKRTLDLLVCHDVHSFHIRYAVDEERKIVYIAEVNPLPGHPLSQEP